MPAGAPYGNRNAEKWTYKKAVRLFHDAIELTNKQEDFKVNGQTVKGYSFDFIGEIARELGTFHEIFEHLSKRFNNINRLKNELYTNIQTNCYSNTKKGIIREATGIVNLKSNWKWTDRIDQNTNINFDPKNIKGITFEQNEE